MKLFKIEAGQLGSDNVIILKIGLLSLGKTKCPRTNETMIIWTSSFFVCFISYLKEVVSYGSWSPIEQNRKLTCLTSKVACIKPAAVREETDH